MAYMQLMGPILSMNIGPTAFSHNILSERSQSDWMCEQNQGSLQKIYTEDENRHKNPKQHKEHTEGKDSLVLL